MKKEELNQLEEQTEEKKKKTGFIYINRKKIGAIITSVALVAGLSLFSIKCCSRDVDDVPSDGTVGNLIDDINNELDKLKNSEDTEDNEATEEEVEEEQTEQQEDNTYNPDDNTNNNNGGNKKPGGNKPGNNKPGGNKPGGNDKPDPNPVDPNPVDPVDPNPVDPVDPTPQPHVHALISDYEAHDENEVCVITRWQQCTDPSCPDGYGLHLNVTVTRQAHQYNPISEVESVPGIWTITDLCSVCSHTQTRFLDHSILGTHAVITEMSVAQNIEAIEVKGKTKTLKLKK